MVDCGAGSAFGTKSVGRAEIVDSYGAYNWDLIRRNCTEPPWIANLVASTAPYELVTWQSPRGCVIIPVAANHGISYDNVRKLIQVVISDGEVFVRALIKYTVLVEGNCRKTPESILYGSVLLVRSCHVFPCESNVKCHFEYQLALEDVSLQNTQQQPLQLTEISNCWENTSVTKLLKVFHRSTGIEFAWETMSSKGGLSADVTEQLIKLKPKLQDRLLAMNLSSDRNKNLEISFWMVNEQGKDFFWIVDNSSLNTNSQQLDSNRELVSNTLAARPLNGPVTIQEVIEQEHLYTKSRTRWTDLQDWLLSVSRHSSRYPDSEIGVIQSSLPHVPSVENMQVEDSFIEELNKCVTTLKSYEPQHQMSQNSSHLKEKVINQLLWAFKCLEDDEET